MYPQVAFVWALGITDAVTRMIFEIHAKDQSFVTRPGGAITDLLVLICLGWEYLFFAIEFYACAHSIKEKLNGREDTSIIKRYKTHIFWSIAVVLSLAMIGCVAAEIKSTKKAIEQDRDAFFTFIPVFVLAIFNAACLVPLFGSIQ